MTKKINRIGETNINTFGSEIIITEYKNSKDINVYFPEYNWTKEHTQYVNFKNRTIRCPYEPRVCGVGYIGEGKYEVSKNKIFTEPYKKWHSMIVRCYSEKSLLNKNTYNNCIVCKEWHNFQNFAEWYENNYYEVKNEEMNLDKDILAKGNKIYGPETCIFVPKRINLLFVNNNNKRGKYPIGVRRSYNKLQAVCIIRDEDGNDKSIFLGSFELNEEDKAFKAYKDFKESYIKEIADKYQDIIPEKLYIAMYNYEIEYND